MRTLLARGHAVRNEAGEVEHWIGVHLDITKRKQAEQRVEDERDFAQAIIETAPEPMIVLDEEHRVVTANPAFYLRFQVQREDTEGTLLHDLGNGQWDIPALHKLLEEALQESDSFDEYEVEHDFPDIGRKVMLVSGRRVERKVNHTEMVLLAIRDVTKARQKEDRLRIAQQTQAVQQERQRLARRLHDHLQQLLIAAKMHIGFVQQGVPDNQDMLNKTTNILDEAIDASRDLAVELTPPALAESGLMGALEWLVDWTQEKHGFHIHLEVQQDVKLGDEQICLLLFDAVRELLLNAIKHAEVDSAKVRAEQQNDGWLQITVEDEGVGYDPNQVDQKDDLAAGFGLSGIRQSVESVGGSFQVESSPGTGTTATIRVPLRQK
jgi:PAS domain S-box-containing protein